MNPQVTRGGRSFRGAFLYYMHDQDAESRDRIDWTYTCNMLTDDPDKAWKVMAFTALSQDRLKQAAGISPGGRKAEKPVFAYSLAWHPDQNPTKEHMLETALASLKQLGLEDHEALIVAHRDQSHKHVHIIANRTNKTTGLMANVYRSKAKLSEFALAYAREHGIEHLAPQRAENAERRKKQEPTKYRDPNIVGAWQSSDSGRGFKAALEEKGYVLAQGRKRIVVIDPYGKTHNPVRHLEGVRTKEFNARLSDLDASRLPDAANLAAEIAARRKAEKPRAISHTPDLKQAFSSASTHVEVPAMPVEEDSPRQEEPVDPRREELIAEYLNRIQSRHHEEHSSLSSHFHRRLLHEETNLRQYYKIRAQERQIKELRKRCARAGFFRKLIGLHKRDREALHRAKLTLENSRMRLEERTGALKKERDRSLQKLKERLRKEWNLALQNAPNLSLAELSRSRTSTIRPDLGRGRDPG